MGHCVWGGLVSDCDETHLGMNAGPFISLFSGIHSKRLMERADKGERMKKGADMNGAPVRGMRKRRECEREEGNGQTKGVGRERKDPF